MPFDIGGTELLLILVIVAMLFGVGKLPEIFGAVGKGVKEFRKEMEPENKPTLTTQPAQPTQPDSDTRSVLS